MATHDYVIDNQSASAFRSDLNGALQAIVTQNSNATAPTTTYANMIWYDTAANQLKKRNEANSAWIVLGTIDEALSTFTPSGERALASQAQAEAGTDNTTIMTPLRSAQAIAALSGSVDYQVFTASGTWTKPSGISADAIVIVQMWAGGGGGSRVSVGTDHVAGGGGGGGYQEFTFPAVLLASTESVSVGAGGPGATTDGADGANGGNSTFGSLVTAYGGGAGLTGSNSELAYGGDGGSVEATGGVWGGQGAIDLSSNTSATDGLYWGGGGGGAGAVGNGADGWMGGGGGGGSDSGGTCLGGTSRYGGAGGNGRVGTGTGSAGGARGGGGGAGRGGNGGAGGRGEVRVWTIG